jgi:HAD superfamily hydrolase (TIGR01509 family)
MYRYMFDLGGVLVEYNSKKLVDRLCEITKGDYETIRNLITRDSLYPVETGRLTGEEYYTRYVKKAMPGFSYNDLIEVYTEHFNPNYPVLDLLKRLKGKGRKVYILSNLADFHRIAAENRIPDIFKLFDKKFFSYEMGYHKPEPEIYREACRQISGTPNKIVFFDDLKENVEGAVREGIRGILFSNDRLSGITEYIRELENDPDF